MPDRLGWLARGSSHPFVSASLVLGLGVGKFMPSFQNIGSEGQAWALLLERHTRMSSTFQSLLPPSAGIISLHAPPYPIPVVLELQPRASCLLGKLSIKGLPAFLTLHTGFPLRIQHLREARFSWVRPHKTLPSRSKSTGDFLGCLQLLPHGSSLLVL